jgi:hypothetical protein
MSFHMKRYLREAISAAELFVFFSMYVYTENNLFYAEGTQVRI